MKSRTGKQKPVSRRQVIKVTKILDELEYWIIRLLLLGLLLLAAYDLLVSKARLSHCPFDEPASAQVCS
jgi:hypothetical protein